MGQILVLFFVETVFVFSMYEIFSLDSNTARMKFKFMKLLLLIFQYFTLPNDGSGTRSFFLRHLYLQFWRRVAVARKFLLYLFAFNVPVDTSFLFHPLSPLVDRPHVGVQTSANGGIKSAVITRLRNFSTAHWRQNFEWGSWTGEFNLKWKC